MSAAVGGPNNPAANQKTAPAVPPRPPQGKLPNATPVTHQNGAAPNGNAAVNGFKPPLPPKPGAAPATIAKPVSQQPRDDGKSTPASAAAAKTEKVADGKVAAMTPLELAKKLAMDIQQRATLVATAVHNVFRDEFAAVTVLHHETGVAPKDASYLRISNSETGTLLEVGYRFGKLLKDAQEILKTPLNAVETKLFPHVLKAAAEKIQKSPVVAGSLAKVEPSVPLINSQIVKAQVVSIIKKYPLA
jgi:hypothetical protein